MVLAGFCACYSLVVLVGNTVYFTVRCRGVEGSGAKRFLSGVIYTVAGTFVFHVICVLYGAEITENVAKTLLFSALLALFSVATPSIAFSGSNTASTNVKTTMWDRFLSVYCYHSFGNFEEFVMFCSSTGTLLGAWLGAFVIPLDWDRAWQQWPISCVYGALMGYTLGTCGGGLLFTIFETKDQKLKKP
eukprot:Nk52_evm70s212 gene=Nk52_evmTU70s212